MTRAICTVHNVECELRPAGVTKAGKAYPAFWACPVRLDDGSYCKAEKRELPEGAPVPVQTSAVPTKGETETNGFLKREQTKQYSITRQHSQEMAIRYLDYCRRHGLDPMAAETLKQVKDFTAVFQGDLDEIDLDEVDQAMPF